MKVRGRAIHPGWAKAELVNAIKLAAEIVARLPQGRALAGDDPGSRGLRPPRPRPRRFVRGRAPLHRPRLRRRDARRARRASCTARRGGLRRPSRAARSTSRTASSTATRSASLDDHPGDRREPRRGRPPRRPRAETDVDPRRHRRLRADGDGPAERRTSSPAAMTRTASASGSASRTWASPRRRSSSSSRSGRNSRVAESARVRWGMEPLLDRLGRPLETLRVSVTDRCNFRCVYCMPKEVFGRDYAFLARASCSRSRRSRASPACSRSSASARCASPAASRSCAATSSTSSRCWPRSSRSSTSR